MKATKIIILSLFVIACTSAAYSDWKLTQPDEHFWGHPGNYPIKFDTLVFNCETENSVKSITIRKESGIPREAIITYCGFDATKKIRYVEARQGHKNTDIMLTAMHFQNNNIKVFSQNDFEIKAIDYKTGNIIFKSVGKGQPTHFEKRVVNINGRIDSSKTSPEWLDVEHIETMAPVRTKDNPGTIITFPESILKQTCFIIITDISNRNVLYVKSFNVD